ncbi:MAG: hypothetical protein WCR52_13415 [Bacteroidota bacterium]
MKSGFQLTNLGDKLFILLPLCYAFLYAPFGINETDGGFLTGLAWQIAQGKTLYADIVYVRPPLPVWLRALELNLWPENWAVLGERWLFYLKVALYSWLAADLLMPGVRRWVLAWIGFIVSVHCYPAAAWHTVDGILFSVLGFWLLQKPAGQTVSALRIWAGVGAVFAALMCKQSFYPLAFWLPLVLYFGLGLRKTLRGVAAFIVYNTLFFFYLYQSNTLVGFLNMTSGASSGGQAWEHGVLDYIRINPMLIGLCFMLILCMTLFIPKRFAGQILPNSVLKKRLPIFVWSLFLLALTGSYAYAVRAHQDFTIPIGHSRLLFCMAVAYGIFSSSWMRRAVWSRQETMRFWTMIAVCWCAAMSWGYSFPILFATPWVYILIETTHRLAYLGGFHAFQSWSKTRNLYAGFWIILLLSVFRLGYEFVYRDGKRSDMNVSMGAIFSRLSGIYSDAETAAMYRELKDLAARYGPDFKTLPAFPLANYLTQTRPLLPLDWVVKRELSGGQTILSKAISGKEITYFIQKSCQESLQTDPELEFTRSIREQGVMIEETAHFWVMKASIHSDHSN